MSDADHARVFSITTGAGRNRPIGQILAIDAGPHATALAKTLGDLPAVDDGWWSPHVWDGNYRKETNWLGTWTLVADIDFHDEKGKHVAPPPEVAEKLKMSADNLPGNLFHPTPRGARVIAVLDRFLDDPGLFEPAARRFGTAVDIALRGAGLAATKEPVLSDRAGIAEAWCAGYKVDEAILADRGRMFFLPNARVDGDARDGVLQTCSEELHDPNEVASWVVQESAPITEPYGPGGSTAEVAGAVAAYNRDHPRDWPKSAGTCPACGHHGCFGTHPRNVARWVCFSTSHEADSGGCGLPGRNCWHGDALDLDAHTEHIDRMELLRREGYLNGRRTDMDGGGEPGARWRLSAGEYKVVAWPRPGQPLFVTLEYLYDGIPAHRDRLDLNSEASRRRFAGGVKRALPDLVDDVREKVEQDLWDLIGRVEACKPDYGDDGQRGSKVADRLVELAKGAVLFHDQDDTCYATVPVGRHRENWPLRSKKLRNWLARRYYEAEKQVPYSQALQDAVGVLEGKALFEGDQREVHVRLAEHDGHVYLDLGRDNWEVVRIAPKGWEVVHDPPIAFRRPKGFQPLPLPMRGGSLAELRPFLNLSTDAEWVLYQACLLAAFRPNRPFPVMVFNGEQGSAKTTAQRIARRLVDPNKAELRSRPRNEHDLVIASRNGWYVALDNLSWMPDWLSDALCRLATGSGFGTRTLYSNDEEELFDGCRPILLNGIENIVTRGDLLDRAVLFYLLEIEEDERRDEEGFWRSFEGVRPRILGALLDALSTALCNLPQVTLGSVPRMADFAKLAVAAEPALDCQGGGFLAAYYQNRDSVHEDALDASVLAKEFLVFVAGLDSAWEGTATELLEALNDKVSDKVQRSKSWPKTPSVLSGALRRLAPNIRGIGVGIDFRREHAGRLFRIWRQDSVTGDTPSRGVSRDGRDDDLHARSEEDPHAADHPPDDGEDGTVEGTV